MKPINNAPLSQFNNAEYTALMHGTSKLITKATPEKLMLPAVVVEAFDKGLGQLTDLQIKMRSFEETGQMLDFDRERDNDVRYIRTVAGRAAELSIAELREPGAKLQALLKNYSGIPSMPNQQETELIEGMLYDFDKPEYTACITALGLDSVVSNLRTVNARYKELSVARTEARAAEALENGKVIRNYMNDQYDKVWLIASAATLLSPSDEVDEFVTGLNKLIDEAKTLYKLRLPHRKTK